MHRLELVIGGNSGCEILIGAGILSGTGTTLGAKPVGKKAVIITDSNVGPLYARSLAGVLERSGIVAEVLTLPAGEQEKSLESASTLYTRLSDLAADRTTAIIALGGGVIGDLAGFVAATYLRGLPFVQVPSSLLAQVDSSIGAKVGVNLARIKNQIGTFYNPVLVVSDIEILKTLPQQEFINGLAEVIKSAAIGDEHLFEMLEAEMEDVLERREGILEEIIYRSVLVKRKAVLADQFDFYQRHVLNFGHTVGHAIEAVSGFGVEHGQAVAAGMLAAARISHEMGMLTRREAYRLEALIQKAGLANQPFNHDPEEIIEAIGHDKKIHDGRLRFVLIKGPGQAVISDNVSLDDIRRAVNAGA